MNKTQLRERFAKTRQTRRELLTFQLDGEPVTVAVRGMTAGSRNDIVRASQYTITDEDGKASVQQDSMKLALLMVVRSLCVPDTDELIFDDKDVSIVEGLTPGEVDRIVEKVSELSGLGKAAHETALGNSAATPASGSPTA